MQITVKYTDLKSIGNDQYLKLIQKEKKEKK